MALYIINKVVYDSEFFSMYYYLTKLSFFLLTLLQRGGYNGTF